MQAKMPRRYNYSVKFFLFTIAFLSSFFFNESQGFEIFNRHASFLENFNNKHGRKMKQSTIIPNPPTSPRLSTLLPPPIAVASPTDLESRSNSPQPSQSDFSRAKGHLQGAASDIGSGVHQSIGNTYGTIQNTTAGVFHGIKNVGDSIAAPVISTAGHVLNVTKNGKDYIVTTTGNIKHKVGNVGEAILNQTEYLWDETGEVASDVWNATRIPKVYNKAANRTAAAAAGVSQAAGDIGGAAKDFGRETKNAVKGVGRAGGTK